MITFKVKLAHLRIQELMVLPLIRKVLHYYLSYYWKSNSAVFSDSLKQFNI